MKYKKTKQEFVMDSETRNGLVGILDKYNVDKIGTQYKDVDKFLTAIILFSRGRDEELKEHIDSLKVDSGSRKIVCNDSRAFKDFLSFKRGIHASSTIKMRNFFNGLFIFLLENEEEFLEVLKDV